MRALITGAAGFVGRHMLRELQSRGWDTIGVDLRPSPYQVDTLIQADARAVFDASLLASERFDLVVHCAYHVGGRAAIDGNPSLLAMNLELDAQMFNWAVRSRQRAVLYFSSSAVYPISYQQGGTQPPLSEYLVSVRDPAQPDARYGWAKLTGEHLGAAATEQGLQVHVVRPFSGYGADQDNTYPFPAILSRVLGGDLSVWGPPGQTRDWIHINDVVDGALAVYEADYREPVNLCTGVGTEFGVLATMMAREVGLDVGSVDPQGCAERVTYLADRPTGVLCRVGDPTRMVGIYRPKIEIGEGIRRAIGNIQ